MRKPVMSYANNKGVDQPAHLVSISEISSLCLASVAANPEDRFSHDMAQLSSNTHQICFTAISNFQPLDVLKRVKDSLTAEKLATSESAKAFLDLLKSLRGVGKDKIAEVMTSSDSYYIVWVLPFIP